MRAQPAGIWAIVLAQLLAGVLIAVAHAEPAHRVDEESLLILSVVLDKSELTDALPAYAGDPEAILVPLHALAEALGLAISYQPDSGVASGFIIAESRTFSLDARNASVSFGGAPTAVDPLQLLESDGDIYVDSRLIARWLPIDLKIEQSIQRLTVHPREKLPVQLRMERERKLAAGRRARRERPSYPPVELPRRLWSRPAVDQTLRFTVGGTAEQRRLTSLITGDLLFMESELFLNGSAANPFDDVRWTLRRRASTPSLGGMLRARDLAFGHVPDSGSSLISASRPPAPGVLVSNHPLSRPEHFDRHTFSGPLLPGWDVELYQNGHLFAYAPSSADGTYLFADVPLRFGLNAFRLVFYGPQGQVRDESQSFLGSDALNGAGEFLYRVVASQDDDRSSSSAAATFGLGRRLTVGGEFRDVSSPAAHRRFAKASARASAGRAFFFGEAVFSNEGSASELGFQVSAEKLSLSFVHSSLSESYVSEVFPEGADRPRQRDRLRLSGELPWSSTRGVLLAVEGQRELLDSGSERLILQSRVAAYYLRTSMNLGTYWQSDAGAVPGRTEARLQLSRPLGKWAIRGELMTTVRPFQGRDVSLTVDRVLGGGWVVSTSLLQSSVGDRASYAVALQKSSGRFAAAITRVADERGGVTRADFFTSFSPGPGDQGWRSDARSRAHRAVASIRLFLDHDGDRKFTPGDEVLPAVRILVNGVDRNVATDAAGIAVITDLIPFQPVDLSIDSSSLDDPLWLPLREGVRLEPRPGAASIVDFPLRQTGEIDGTVYRTAGDETRALPATTVELLNAAGVVIQRVRSAFDGFYIFSGVFAGEYRVRAAGSERAVTVPEDGGAISGVDLVGPGERGP